MTAEAALARLRDAQDPALGELAVVALKVLGEQPVHALLDAEALAKHVASGLRHAVARPEAHSTLTERVHAERARLAAETRTARTFVPAEADAVVRAVLAQPWVPSEALTYKVINHDAVRTLVREVLQTALGKVMARMRHLDEGTLGGVGGRVARKGKGLFGGVAGNLGAAAEGLMGAVRDEIGANLEAKVRDAVGGVTDEAIRGIAAWVSNPAHAEPVAALRLSILDVVLDVPIGELLGELDDVPTAAVTGAVWEGLAATAARPDLDAHIAEALAEALAPWGEERLSDWLDMFDLHTTAQAAVAEAVDPWARTLVRSDAFESWWSQLFS